MPVYQGIKLDVISQLELRIHPEFPHPESSQFTYRSPNVRDETSVSNLVSPSMSSDSKADRILGRPSTISVYIPSHPGARFWLRYDLTEVQAPKAPWHYFKLFMNGRHITSWGTHSIFKPRGQVMQALYDPTPRWNYKHDETVYKNCGTEIRPFYFSNVKGRSAADDGGLIEVRVFRARGRTRKLAKPAEFKPQDQYGLVLPSTGLIEDPQDARYYDWLLIDPTDRPLATFKFHYRSWDNLSSLHLIPANHPRTLLSSSPSLLSLNGQSSNALRQKEATKRAEVERHREDMDNLNKNARSFGVDSAYRLNSNSAKYELTPLTHAETSVTEATYDGESDRMASFQVPRSPSPHYRILSPPGLQALGFTAPPVPRLLPATQLEWAEILNRPLPEIPRENKTSQPSRRLSISSDKPVLKIATTEQFHKPTYPPKLIEVKRNLTREDHLSESARHPAPTSVPSKRQSGGIFSNITLRKHPKSSPSKSRRTVKTYSSDYNEIEQQEREEYGSRDDMTLLSLTESQWLSSTLPPNGNISRHKHMDQTRDKYSNDAEERALLKKQAMDWYERATVTAADSGKINSSRDCSAVKAPGDWV